MRNAVNVQKIFSYFFISKKDSYKQVGLVGIFIRFSRSYYSVLILTFKQDLLLRDSDDLLK